MADPAKSIDQNLLPVQAYFSVDGEFQTFIGQGQPFYATVNPDQSGLHITNSTIDSTTIGATTPSTGVFTNVSTTTGTISTAPVSNTDIANKQYVDAVAQGLKAKQAVKCATTGDIVLLGLQTIDTYTTLAGDRVLVKDQLISSQNGIYIAAVGAWTRSTDMDTWSEVPGSYTVALNGSVNLDTGWVCTAAETGTIGVTAMPWVQFSGSATYYAGTGLTLAANTFSITDTIGSPASIGQNTYEVIQLDINAQGQITGYGASSIGIDGSQIVTGTVSPTYGGTGVNNGSNTLTFSGSYTLDQSVASGSSPSFLGANFSAIPNSALSHSSITLNGSTISLGDTATITAVNPNVLTLGTGLSGTSYNGSVAVTAAIANTGVTANSYTYGSFTVNAQGQLTAASSNATTGFGSIVLAAAPTVSGEWSSFDSVSFNTSATPTSAVGKVYWDGGTTLNIGMTANVTQKVGEDQFYYIKASSAIAKGQVVMFTGSVGASGVITGAPATGVTDGSYIMGVSAEAISLNGFGLVQSFGILRNVNTSGYSDGDILWYNPAVTGGLTKTKPSAPNVKVQMAAVVNGGSSGGGVIQIRVNSGSVLGGTDSNVEFGSLSNGDVIVYNSTAGYWQNQAQSTLAVGTATNLAGGVAGAIPYQSGVGATGFTAAGTSGQVLTSQGTGTPTWTTPTAYATVTDDTTTNATRYPLFAAATSGNLTTEYTSSTKYQFNPSTGVLTATQFSGSAAGLTSVPAGQLTGTIPSGVLGNSSLYIGTTSIALNRSSASQSLTGVSIDGSAGSATTATTATNATNVAITDDTTTNATVYPTWVTTTTGNLPEKTSSTKLKFNPSTGALTVSQLIIAP